MPASTRFNNALRYRAGDHDRQVQLTPPYVLERARLTLGSIDLDPATEPDNPTDASKYFTAADDGLAQPHDFYTGAVELADKAWLVIDSDSEEALVRSFLRHDPVLHQPRLAVSMVKAYDKVASATLRAAVVHELRRLHFDQPRLKAWEDERVLNILDHPAVDGKEIAPGFDVPLGVGLGVADTQTLLSVSGSPTTSTSTSTATSNLQPAPNESEAADKSSRWSA